MNAEQLVRYIIEILNRNGVYSSPHPLSMGYIFEDEKIILEGFLDRENRSRFHSIYVGLKLPHADDSPVLFGLPNIKNDKSTVVFYAQRHEQVWVSHYERPGKWLLYVKYLYSVEMNKTNELMAQNHQSVNDNELFSDINLEDPGRHSE